MNVDPVLVEALGLDPATAEMSSYGGLGFTSTFMLTGVRDGEEAKFLVKTGSGPESEVMFRGMSCSRAGRQLLHVTYTVRRARVSQRSARRRPISLRPFPRPRAPLL